MKTERRRSGERTAPAMLAGTALILGIGIGIALSGIGKTAPETEQIWRLPTLGGDGQKEQTVDLEPGTKLIDVTWQCFGGFPCSIWVLTRTGADGEPPITYRFRPTEPRFGDGAIYVIREHPAGNAGRKGTR